ncbi:protein ecdysoneless homolog [Trichonephila inaurata madagascariensis]|uniref:Protein ecdysoneless homolog n=1 Tax=Trichonephila inaurata madagascariensis TaxID=2747483 RepID=A0A8X6M908_9ARAC|nr:protein ecdysoneless homolog [Trichonephila inaurata madagascariensis]
MASSSVASENTVIYKLFCTNSDGNSNLIHRDFLDICAEKYLSQITGFLRRYIWQNEPFNLRVVESLNTAVPVYLEGITSYEDNVEDEWFIVYLLFYLSEKDKNLVIQVQDNDGEFLLIEAANHLPKWLNPDTCENRIFIYQGALHIIPITSNPADITPLSNGIPSLSDAISVVRQFSSVTKASPSIQEAVKNRIKEYPMRIDEYKHRAHCYVPCAVAAILKEDPSLLPYAVKAFYLRDPIDLKACRAMKFFAPETRVMSEVIFTRCLYAQLSCQKYEPDKMTGWNLPEVNNSDRKAHELGMKLACGFEILASNAQSRMQMESKDLEHDFCNDIRWRRFAKSLKDKGYFRDEVEGSKMYNTLLLQAKEFYLSSLKHRTTANVSPGIRVQKLLRTVNANFEEMKEAEKMLRPADDDSWMDITPEILDSMLEKMSNQATESKIAKSITSGIKSFVQTRSDIEGVEPALCTQKKKKQKINFDPDAFADAVNAILDKYNVSNKKGKILDDMKDYMDEMDRQLANTNIGLSFEKLPPRAIMEDEEMGLIPDKRSDIDDEEDDFRPVDVDLNALKNMLESYSSQQGLPGPVSNIFSSMGMEVPDNVDS